jgi:signal transduction histidine kinase
MAGSAVTASGALHQGGLLSGVGTGDLIHILAWVAGAVLLTAILGTVAVRALAQRSVRVHVALVAAICVITAMITTGEIATIMLSPGDRVVMLELMGISGIASLVVSLIVGRSIGRASRALLDSVHEVGESGIYTPPDTPLPAELAGLSEGIAEAHDKLGQARARQQALEASRRELVAWVSHDLRTPLAGLRAMAEALEDQVVTDPREVSHYHSQIRVETERLALMIEDLFELSKIHAGALRLSRRVVGLEDVVAEVVASAEPVARAKRVHLTGSAVRGMPVLIDSAEFGRAVRNLMINAIRHTPPNGTIEVLGEIQSGMACVSVADECGGIPPGDLSRVFDVAFRGESARTPDPSGGAGLGLSIARGIVEAHAGEISVRNTGPGCEFLITLPLARPAPAAVSRPAPSRADRPDRPDRAVRAVRA